MTSDSVSIIVRTILNDASVEVDGSKTFTSHSMKTTLLSWCGKAGIGKPHRLTLGAHSQGKDCMADLYSRDELAEPLRQLGFVLAWVMQRSFLPDSTKSGRWITQPDQATDAENRHISAGAYLEAMTRRNGKLPAQPPPELEDPVEIIEVPNSDVEEVDEEDEDRDDVQARAAEVHTDSAHARSSTNKPSATKAYVPEMPNLEFAILRNVFRGSRHWCVKGGHVLCQPSGHDPNQFGPATSHDDPFCIKCLQVAKEQYDVQAPERFAHGENLAEESTASQSTPGTMDATPVSTEITDTPVIEGEIAQNQPSQISDPEDLSQGKRPVRVLRISSK